MPDVRSAKTETWLSQSYVTASFWITGGGSIFQVHENRRPAFQPKGQRDPVCSGLALSALPWLGIGCYAHRICPFSKPLPAACAEPNEQASQTSTSTVTCLRSCVHNWRSFLTPVLAGAGDRTQTKNQFGI